MYDEISFYDLYVSTLGAPALLSPAFEKRIPGSSVQQTVLVLLIPNQIDEEAGLAREKLWVFPPSLTFIDRRALW